MDVLLFPRTEPDNLLIQSLLFFFDGAVCLRPLEEEGNTVAVSTDIDARCQQIVPAPLGVDRSRFIRMLRDLRSHPDEYYEGFLRSLSDSVSGHRPVLVEELIAGFAPHMNGEAAEEKDRAETLWQARLVLSLAELVEAEEVAVAAGLAAVEAREQELLANLHGETDLPDDEDMDFHRQIAPALPSMYTGVPTGQCCLAWAQLFLILEEAPWPVLAVTSPDALAWLGNQYEKKTRTAPVEFGQLSLPEADWADAVAVRNMRAKLQGEAAGILAGLHQLIRDTAAGRETAESATGAFLRLAGQWTQGLAANGHRPGAGGSLRFVLFPERSFSEILAAALRQPAPAPDSPMLRQGIAVFWERQ